MSYYQPNSEQLIEIIVSLEETKSTVNFGDLENAIPKQWRLNGCGTGNLQKAISDLFKRGYIDSAEQDRETFRLGQEMKFGNRPFFLTPLGYNQTKPFYIKYWQVAVGLLVSIGSIVTAIYTVFTYYK